MLTKKQRDDMRKGLIHCDLSPLDESERNLEACLNDLDERDEPSPTFAWCNTCGISIPTDKSSLANHKCV